jgi:hypothetical protein
MSRRALAILIVCGVSGTLLLASNAGLIGKPVASDQTAILEAADWIKTEDKVEAEYHYVMTCRLHLFLFWAGRDDVGGGYVRIGKAANDERIQIIQILFGSDPSKAPLGINRWGAGTEYLRGGDSGQPQSSAFFGFIKSSKGQSVMAMQREISRERNNGTHLFDGIMSRVDPDRALSTTIPYSSPQDLDFRQYPEGEKAALQQLENNPSRQVRRLEGEARASCPRAGEFLSTTLQLLDDALDGHAMPDTLCYIYNARHYQATLVSAHPVDQKKIHVALHDGTGALDRTYRHLLDTQFSVLNQETQVTSLFEIFVGTEGKLRGTPVQIDYEPNWWFQIILNLQPGASPSNKAGDGAQ